MKEINESEVLAKIRTLLALERNFLAEERTALAEFRTGLALAVIGPTVGTIMVFLISIFALEQSRFLDILNFTFFIIITIIGIWIAYKSEINLKKLRKKKVIIKDRMLEASKSSKEIFSLLSDWYDQ
ncbi:MAG: DUF202 domain-containing protein [Candidatus Heimdallarchaeota archaeon]|nr:DUF202 domain-containing protein [Candidatus Heimdallarchaeota archaeon]MCK5145067.1 DUF202 domain-containing protein [Candidatus Heimdallarchaeota archaeon]